MTCEGVDVQNRAFINAAGIGVERSPSRPSRFIPDAHWIGGWVSPKTGLDDVERRKILLFEGIELRPIGRPARSQSLYRPNPYWSKYIL
jgi:hypothetical protein